MPKETRLCPGKIGNAIIIVMHAWRTGHEQAQKTVPEELPSRNHHNIIDSLIDVPVMPTVNILVTSSSAHINFYSN